MQIHATDGSGEALDRRALKNAYWAWLDPSIETYSREIRALLSHLTDEQLEEFVRSRVKDDDHAANVS